MERGDDPDARILRPREDAGHGRDHPAKLHRHIQVLPPFGETEQLGRQLGSLLRRPLDDPGGLGDLRVDPLLDGEQVRVPEDAGQQVVEVMGDPPREQAHRLHLLGLAQLFLQFLPLGNVDPRADQARLFLPREGMPGEVIGHLLPAFRDKFRLHLGGPLLERVRDPILDQCLVRSGEQVQRMHPADFLRGVPGDFLKIIIPSQELPLPVEQIKDSRQAVEDRFREIPFQQDQLFGLFARGDVARVNAVVLLPVELDVVRRDLHGDKMSVLRAVRRFGREGSPLAQLVPVVRPPLGRELRVDLLDLLGKELFPRIAEHLARPVVDVDEMAVRTHPVGGFASPVDRELGEAQRDVGSFPVGNVEDEAVDPPQPPILAVDHLATVRHPPDGTVPVQKAVLEPEDALAGPHGLEDTLFQHALVLGVDDLMPRFSGGGKFLGGIPDDLLDVRAHERQRPVGESPVDHSRDVVHEGDELKGQVPLLLEDPGLPYGEPPEKIHGTRPPPFNSYRHAGEKSLPVLDLLEHNLDLLESAREAVYK